MKYLTVIFILLILLIAPTAFAQMPVRNPGWAQVNPPFEGVEAFYSSATMDIFNYYGNYWGDVMPGVVIPAPNDLLDGVIHQDTVASAATLGDIIVATAGGWDDLPPGANGDVLTIVAGVPAYAPPVSQAWVQIAETLVTAKGADFSSRGGAVALADIAADVAVIVTCRLDNAGVVWQATSSPMPISDLVTYYWIEDGAGNLTVQIVNSSQVDVYATVAYTDLG